VVFHLILAILTLALHWLQATLFQQENMDLYNKINQIRQENSELYKKVADELNKNITE